MSTVSSGQTEYVSLRGRGQHDGGERRGEAVISGGTAGALTVLSGGRVVISAGTVTGLTVSSGGNEILEVVSSGVGADIRD